MLENLYLIVEIRILEALKFPVESYDLTAQSFSVVTFLQGGIEFLWISSC